MCCVDALFTLNLMAVGAEEMNILMDHLISNDVERFLAIKIGVTGASVVLLGVAARRQFLGVIPVFRVLQAVLRRLRHPAALGAVAVCDLCGRPAIPLAALVRLDRLTAWGQRRRSNWPLIPGATYI